MRTRALDLFVEKQACDRSVDSGASRALSSEVNDICRTEEFARRQSLTSQDKVALSSLSIAFGSPLLLFGLGTTFAIMDDFAFRNSSKDLTDASQNKVHRTALRKGAILEGDKDKLSESKIPITLLSLDLIQTGKTSKSKPKDQAVFEDRKRNRSFLFASKSWLEVSKLVKQKQFLLYQVEKLNKGQKLSLVSNLLSQIEVLDKALKRLGC